MFLQSLSSARLNLLSDKSLFDICLLVPWAMEIEQDWKFWSLFFWLGTSLWRLDAGHWGKDSDVI